MGQQPTNICYQLNFKLLCFVGVKFKPRHWW